MNRKIDDFHLIYKDYFSHVRNTLYRLGVVVDLEDLVQEVFLKIYLNLSQFKGQAQLKTWIYRITVNHYYDYLKRKESWWRHILTPVQESIVEPMKQEATSEWQQLMKHLTDMERTLFVLHYAQEMTFDELALVLKRSSRSLKRDIEDLNIKVKNLIK